METIVFLILVAGIVFFASRNARLARKVSEIEKRLEGQVPEKEPAETPLRVVPLPPDASSLPDAGKMLPEPPAPVTASVSPRPPASSDLLTVERVIGQRWLVWAGVIVFAAGFSLFLRYAFQQGWLSERVRVVLGVVAAVGFALAGERFHHRRMRALAEGLQALGIILAYLSVYAAGQLYRLVPPHVCLLLLFVVTAAGGGLALARTATSTAFLSVLGAFLVPLLLSAPACTSAGVSGWLVAYLLIVIAGVLLLVSIRPFSGLALFALACAAASAWSLAPAEATPAGIVTVFVSASFVLFAFAACLPSLARNEKAGGQQTALVVANAAVTLFLFWWLALPSRDGLSRALLTYTSLWLLPSETAEVFPIAPLGMAAVLFLLAGLVHRMRRDQTLYYVLAGTAVGVLTLPAPLMRSGLAASLAWAADALLLVGFGLLLRRHLLRTGGLVVLVLLAVRVLTQDTHLLGADAIFFNRPFLSVFACCLAFLACGLMLRRSRTTIQEQQGTAGWVLAGFGCLLFLVINAEILSHYRSPAGTLLPFGHLYASFWWAGFSIFLLWAGFLRHDHRQRTAGVALAAAGVLKALFLDMPACFSNPFGLPFLLNLRSAALLLPLAIIGCAAHLYAVRADRAQPRERSAVPALWALFASGLFLGLTIEVCACFLSSGIAQLRMAALVATSVLWALCALVFVVIGADTPSHAWRAAGICLLTVVVFKAGVIDATLLYRVPYGFPLFLNLKFLSVCLVLFVLAYAAAAYAESGFDIQPWEKDAGAYLWSLFLGLLFVELNVETSSAFSTVWTLADQTAALALSLVWVFYGLEMLLVGVFRKVLPLRIAALCLFGATLLKIWTVDLRCAELPFKMVALLGAGMAFLIGAYLYRRFSARVFGQTEEPVRSAPDGSGTDAGGDDATGSAQP